MLIDPTPLRNTVTECLCHGCSRLKLTDIMQHSTGTGIGYRWQLRLEPELEFEGHSTVATAAAFPNSARHIARIFIQYNLLSSA